MLTRRLISAAILISGVLLLAYFDFWLGKPEQTGRPGIILGTLAVLGAAICSGEMVQLFRQKCPYLNLPFAMAVGSLAVLVCCAPIAWRVLTLFHPFFLGSRFSSFLDSRRFELEPSPSDLSEAR